MLPEKHINGCLERRTKVLSIGSPYSYLALLPPGCQVQAQKLVEKLA